jgi:hypothetical protein
MKWINGLEKGLEKLAQGEKGAFVPKYWNV